MSGTTRHTEAQQHLDALRQRLYRSDATEEDLRRYLAEREVSTPPEPAPAVAPPRRRRLLLPALVVVVLLASTAGVALTAQRAVPPQAVATPTARSDGALASVVAVDGSLAAAPGGRVLRTHESRTASPDGDAVLSQRFDGSGATVVPLDLTAAPFDGGQAVITLTTSRPGTDGWRAIRVRTRTDWSSYAEVVARGPSTGVAISFATIAQYDGNPPGWIAVDAASGVRWTLAVMLLPAIAKHPDCADLQRCVAS